MRSGVDCGIVGVNGYIYRGKKVGVLIVGPAGSLFFFKISGTTGSVTGRTVGSNSQFTVRFWG